MPIGLGTVIDERMGATPRFFVVPVLAAFLTLFCSPEGGRVAAQAVPAAPASEPTPSSAAGGATPAPEPTPDLIFGSTPAQGCPRFFIGLTLARINACADQLAEKGWGLSAAAYRGSIRGEYGIDLLVGEFEPHTPKRWVESDDEPAPAENATGYLVNVVGVSDHLILMYQQGPASKCSDLTLYRPYDFHVPDEHAYFTKVMAEEAAGGCIPGSYYSLIRREAIQQEDPDVHIAFVAGDPHTTAAFWPRNDAERQAFEKRAAARGFQRLSLDEVPDRWGKTAGPRFVEEIGLGPPPTRYDALEARLRTAAERGERIVDIRVVSDDRVLKGLRILWERPSSPPASPG